MFRTRPRLIAAVLFLTVVPAAPLPAWSQPPPEGRRYALLVGVGQYSKDQLTPLKFPERDVEELARVLEEAGYPKDNVVLMTARRGPEDARFLPTARQIRRQLGLLVAG